MKTKLAILILLLALGSSLYAQGPVQVLFGSGVPGGSVASVAGTHYVDNSVNPPVTYICTSVSVAAGPTPPAGTQTCNWTQIGAGGGITPVTSIPATCTFGTSTPVFLTVAPGSIYYCQPNGTYQSTAYPPSIFDPSNPQYAGGVQAGRYIQDATFANGANTIDCTFTNDCNFVASMNNQVCYGTNINGDTTALTSVVVLPEGLLTVVDAQHATCSGGNSTATVTHLGTFVWGPLATATAAQVQGTTNDPLFAAWTAVLAACAQGSPVLVRWPPGPILVERSFFNTGTTSTCTAATPSGWSGITLKGAAGISTQFMPTPSFKAADCVGGPGGDLNGCMLSAGGFFFQDFGVYGAGQSAIGAGFNGKVGIIVHGNGASNSYVTNLNLLSWGTATTGFAGIKFENMSDTVESRMINDGFGNNPNCWVKLPVSGLTNFEGVNCTVAAVTNLLVDGTAGVSSFTSHGGTYGFTATGSGTPPIVTTNASGSVAAFYGDVNPYQTGAGQSLISAQGAGLTILNGVTFSNSGAGKFGIGTFTAGNIVVRDSFISCTSCTAVAAGNGGNIQMDGGSKVVGTVAVQTSVGGKFCDCGFDSYTGTVTNNGTIFGSGHVTGTALVTGNVGLTSGWSTSSVASVAPNSDSHAGSFTITGAAGSANPTITITFPVPFLTAPPSAELGFGSAGATTDFTNSFCAAPSTTAVVCTLIGTSTAVSIVLTYRVGP